MRFGIGRFIAFIVLTLVLVGYYKYAYPTYSWQQTTKIVVQTPIGLVSGSSTANVEWRTFPKIFPDMIGFESSFVGEATIVDLGSDKYIFALLSGAPALGPHVFKEEVSAYNTYINLLSSSNFELYLKQTTKAKGVTKAIPLKYYPKLVTYSDIKDPASLRLVDPEKLATIFGAGYAMKSITLEITDLPVSAGKVEGMLWWWDKITVGIGGNKNRKYGDPLYKISRRDFKVEN